MFPYNNVLLKLPETGHIKVFIKFPYNNVLLKLASAGNSFTVSPSCFHTTMFFLNEGLKTPFKDLKLSVSIQQCSS